MKFFPRLDLQAHGMNGDRFLPSQIQGKVVARFEGRLAPEAWDGVADLMPWCSGSRTATEPVLEWISITRVRHTFQPNTQGLNIALGSSPMTNCKYYCSTLREPTATPDEALVRIEPEVIIVYGQRATGAQYLINSSQASGT